MTLTMPRNELAPHSTPPGPVTISIRLTLSSGSVRLKLLMLPHGSWNEMPSCSSKAAWVTPRTTGSPTWEPTAQVSDQPGTVWSAWLMNLKPRALMSSDVMMVMIAGAS